MTEESRPSVNLYQKTYRLPIVEFYKFQLNISINLPVHVLNDTDVTILAYVVVYGEEAKRKIVEDRILTSPFGCLNYLRTLCDMNYLVKEVHKGRAATYKINPKILLINEPFKMILSVEPNIEDHANFHRFYKPKDKK